MPIDEKKPRLKFNFFDILILAALMLVIVFSLYSRVITQNENQADGTDGFQYTLKVERVENELVSMISLGDILYEAESEVELGRVVEITVTDYALSNPSAAKTAIKDGQGYSNLEIILECHGASYVDDGGVINVQSNGYEMRVGTDIRVRNTEFIFTAQCSLGGKAEVENEKA